MKIPETLVVGINTHGEIPVDSTTNKPLQFRFDDADINIYKLSASAPGVSNISTIEPFESMNQKISECVQDMDQISSKMAKIKKICRSNNRENLENMMRDPKIRSDAKFREYMHQYDNAFQWQHIATDCVIDNKTYIKFTEEEIRELDIESKEPEYFNRIVFYNMDNIDLFTLIESVMDTKIETLTLKDLIDFIINLGKDKVKTIIFVDLSCSTFHREDGHALSPREIRAIRRSL